MGQIILISLIVAVAGIWLGSEMQKMATNNETARSGQILAGIGTLAAIIFLGILLYVIGKFIYGLFI